MKALLFDFDGTLVDSMPVYGKTMLRILDEHGIRYGEDLLKIITPLGTVGTADYYIKMGLALSRDEILSLMRTYLCEEYFYHIPAKEFVISTLDMLRLNGVRLNILTASPHITLDVCLKRLGIYDWFENVWSCEDFSTTKSDVSLYHTVSERLGVREEEILFLDDNLNACKTAKASGMRVCGVYDDSSKEYTEEMLRICDDYIRDFSELMTLPSVCSGIE